MVPGAAVIDYGHAARVGVIDVDRLVVARVLVVVGNRIGKGVRNVHRHAHANREAVVMLSPLLAESGSVVMTAVATKSLRIVEQELTEATVETIPVAVGPE